MVLAPAMAAQLQPKTKTAFDRYIQLTEARLAQDLKSGKFLVAGRNKSTEIRTVENQTRENGKEIEIPEGQVQHWLGAMFIPNAKLDQVRAVMQDYDNYKTIYNPDVTDSKLLKREGDDFDVFLRLYKKQIITVVFNANYHVRYVQHGPTKLSVISRSTRIAQLRDPNVPAAGEHPVGNDHGFLWALNSYWRFEEADGGVYVECEAVSLSRDVPMLVGPLVSGFIKKFPIEGMKNTLMFTKKAVEERAKRASLIRTAS
jgi:hypothetical protein